MATVTRNVPSIKKQISRKSDFSKGFKGTLFSVKEKNDSIYPIQLYCLNREAMVRAHELSVTGLKYKKINEKIYKYTQTRLMRMFNHHKAYTQQFINIFNGNQQPGFLLYSKNKVDLIPKAMIKLYNSSKMSLLDIEKDMRMGLIIRIDQEEKLDNFEAYVVDPSDWSDIWIKSLPLFTSELITEVPVLPIFTKGTQIIKYGNTALLTGLPKWYIALETIVDGIPLFDQDGKVIKDFNTQSLLCDPVSPYRDNINYVRDVSMIKNRFDDVCLVLGNDLTSKNFDNKVLTFFKSLSGYITYGSTFAWVDICIGRDKIMVHVKLTRKLYEVLNKKPIIGEFGTSQEKLLFDLLFKGYKPNDGDTLNLSENNSKRFMIKFRDRSNGLLTQQGVMTLVGAHYNFGYSNYRLGIINNKGSLKSRFKQYIEGFSTDSRKITVIDSDDYGFWVSKKKGKDDKISYLVYLASEMLIDEGAVSYGKLSIYNRRILTRKLAVRYQDLLSSAEVGIKTWQLESNHLESNGIIIFMLHSHLELRTMYVNNFNIRLKTPINSVKVIEHRMERNADARNIELFLYDMYNEHINTTSVPGDYVDIIRFLQLDDSVDLDFGG